MAEFDAFGTAVIIAMVVAYILLTSWLTVRLRSRTVDQAGMAQTRARLRHSGRPPCARSAMPCTRPWT